MKPTHMRFSAYIILFIFCLGGDSDAQPVNSYTSPFISEFQAIDSIHWSIELGGSGYFTGWVSPPCSSSIFKFRINSSGKINDLKVYFDSTGIALITRASFGEIPQEEYVSIQNFDTIQILDNTWNDSNNSRNLWKFVVLPVKPGNSLVNCSNGLQPFETVRPSIGSKGNYTTTYQIICFDEQNDPIPGVEIYQWVTDPFYPAHKESFGFTDACGLLCCIIADAGCSSKSIGSLFIEKNGYSIVRLFNCPYIDTALNATATAILSKQSSTEHSCFIQKANTIRFTALYSPKFGIIFKIVSSVPIPEDSKVMIYNLSGKIVTNLIIDLHNLGTHLVFWNSTTSQHRWLYQGTYLSKLVVDDNSIASQIITIP